MRKQPQQLFLSRGIGLIDALIALAILSFGMLGMARFQSRIVMGASESQSRTVAAQFNDELINTALATALAQAPACGSV